jgi:hypothetical protein
MFWGTTPANAKRLSLLQNIHAGSAANPAFYSMNTGVAFTAGKVAGHEANSCHLVPSAILLLQLCLHGVNRNSTTFYLYQHYVRDPQSTTLYICLIQLLFIIRLHQLLPTVGHGGYFKHLANSHSFQKFCSLIQHFAPCVTFATVGQTSTICIASHVAKM